MLPPSSRASRRCPRQPAGEHLQRALQTPGSGAPRDTPPTAPRILHCPEALPLLPPASRAPARRAHARAPAHRAPGSRLRWRRSSRGRRRTISAGPARAEVRLATLRKPSPQSNPSCRWGPGGARTSPHTRLAASEKARRNPQLHAAAGSAAPLSPLARPARARLGFRRVRAATPPPGRNPSGVVPRKRKCGA